MCSLNCLILYLVFQMVYLSVVFSHTNQQILYHFLKCCLISCEDRHYSHKLTKHFLQIIQIYYLPIRIIAYNILKLTKFLDCCHQNMSQPIIMKLCFKYFLRMILLDFPNQESNPWSPIEVYTV